LPYVAAGSWYVPLNPGQGNRINALAALGYVAIIYGAAALPRRSCDARCPDGRQPCRRCCSRPTSPRSPWRGSTDSTPTRSSGAAGSDSGCRARQHAPLRPAARRRCDDLRLRLPDHQRPRRTRVPLGHRSQRRGSRHVRGPLAERLSDARGHDAHLRRREHASRQQRLLRCPATPYGATVLFDATSGRSARIHNRRDCERGARTFVAGPGRFGPE